MWELSSNWSCRLRWFLEIWPDTVSTWTSALLSVERFVALFFPLWHRRFKSHRTTRLMLILILLLALLFVAPNVWFTTAQRTIYNPMEYCFPSMAGASWASLTTYIVFSVFGVYLYPLALCFVFTALIIYKLVSLAGADRRALGIAPSPVVSNVRVVPQRRERQTGVTIVFLLLADLTIYFPVTAFFTGYCIIQVASRDAFWTQSIMATLSFTFFNISILKRFSNLYIYLIRIPATRRGLLCQKSVIWFKMIFDLYSFFLISKSLGIWVVSQFWMDSTRSSRWQSKILESK